MIGLMTTFDWFVAIICGLHFLGIAITLWEGFELKSSMLIVFWVALGILIYRLYG